MLDRAFSLSPDGDARWRAFADPALEANTGMFGGWTAALAIRAAAQDAGDGFHLLSLTVNFAKRIEPNTEVSIRRRNLGGGRSLRHLGIDFHDGDGGLCAMALAVLASRRESDGFDEAIMPAAPDPRSIPIIHPPGAFGAAIDMAPVTGFPPFRQESTRSIAWTRCADGEPLDHARLAFVADATPPRIFFIGDAPRPSSTVTLSIYFHGSASDITGAGGDFILSEVSGVAARASVFSHFMRLWRADGVLLATSEQLCWFR